MKAPIARPAMGERFVSLAERAGGTRRRARARAGHIRGGTRRRARARAGHIRERNATGARGARGARAEARAERAELATEARGARGARDGSARKPYSVRHLSLNLERCTTAASESRSSRYEFLQLPEALESARELKPRGYQYYNGGNKNAPWATQRNSAAQRADNRRAGAHAHVVVRRRLPSAAALRKPTQPR